MPPKIDVFHNLRVLPKGAISARGTKLSEQFISRANQNNITSWIANNPDLDVKHYAEAYTRASLPVPTHFQPSTKGTILDHFQPTDRPSSKRTLDVDAGEGTSAQNKHPRIDSSSDDSVYGTPLSPDTIAFIDEVLAESSSSAPALDSEFINDFHMDVNQAARDGIAAHVPDEVLMEGVEPAAGLGGTQSGGGGQPAQAAASAFYPTSSRFRQGKSIYDPVYGTHTFKSWGLARVHIQGTLAQGGHYEVTPAACIPVHRKSLYFPHSLENTLPPGVQIDTVEVVVINRGVTTSFEVGTAASSTGNTQVPCHGFSAVGLETQTSGGAIYEITRSSTAPMVASAVKLDTGDMYDAQWLINGTNDPANANTNFPTVLGAVRSIRTYYCDWRPNNDHAPDRQAMWIPWYQRVKRFDAWKTQHQVIATYRYKPKLCWCTAPFQTSSKGTEWELFFPQGGERMNTATAETNSFVNKQNNSNDKIQFVDIGVLGLNYTEFANGGVYNEKSDLSKLVMGAIEQSATFAKVYPGYLEKYGLTAGNHVQPKLYVGIEAIQRPSHAAQADSSGWTLAQCQWEVRTKCTFKQYPISPYPAGTHTPLLHPDMGMWVIKHSVGTSGTKWGCAIAGASQSYGSQLQVNVPLPNPSTARYKWPADNVSRDIEDREVAEFNAKKSTRYTLRSRVAKRPSPLVGNNVN